MQCECMAFRTTTKKSIQVQSVNKTCGVWVSLKQIPSGTGKLIHRSNFFSTKLYVLLSSEPEKI